MTKTLDRTEERTEEQRRAEHKARAEEALRARQKSLAKLREIGPGLMWPTTFRPHLCCAKKPKDAEERPEHGVSFRRESDCVLVEASNGVASVSICLAGEGEQVPGQVVVPARAMALIAASKADFAQIWFHDQKVTIFVDDALHEFYPIPRELPFPTENLRVKGTGSRSLSSCTFDAAQLHRIQKALGAEQVVLRQAGKHLLTVLPSEWDARGESETLSLGFLVTHAD